MIPLLVILLLVTCRSAVFAAADAAGSSARDSWYPYYWCYYWWNYPYCYHYPPYYYSTPTVDTPKVFELRIATNPPAIAAVIGGGSYNEGTVASFSMTSLIVPAGADQRYVFSYWSGDFSGSAPSGSITMMSAKNIIANYHVENYLRVSVDPSGIVPAIGTGWYQSDEQVTVGPVERSISGGEGTRYIFQHWTVDGVTASANPVVVQMNAPHTVVAHYKTQYLLKVSSDFGPVQGGGWYDAGSFATFSVTRQVDIRYGVKQVFERWAGDAESTSSSVTVKMDSPRTVWAVWRPDSTILYATIALGFVTAIALVICLAAVLIMRTPRAKSVSHAPPEPARAIEQPPKKVKSAHTRKNLKRPPKEEDESTEPTLRR